MANGDQGLAIGAVTETSSLTASVNILHNIISEITELTTLSRSKLFSSVEDRTQSFVDHYDLAESSDFKNNRVLGCRAYNLLNLS